MKKVMIILGVALIGVTSCQKRKECKTYQNRYNMQKETYLNSKHEAETHDYFVDVSFDKAQMENTEKTAKMLGCKLKK